LTRIVLNLEINLERTDIFKILSLLIYEHSISLHFFNFSHHTSVKFSVYRSCTHFVRFILKIFMLCCCKWPFLFQLSIMLLAYRNRFFSIFTLIPETLINSILWCFFFINFLGFSIHNAHIANKLLDNSCMHLFLNNSCENGWFKLYSSLSYVILNIQGNTFYKNLSSKVRQWHMSIIPVTWEAWGKKDHKFKPHQSNITRPSSENNIKNLSSIYNLYYKFTCGRYNSSPQRCPCTNPYNPCEWLRTKRWQCYLGLSG
jgi:hypothetical protein